MHDRPQSTEILEAVARLLLDEIVPATSGRLQFLARVGANAVRLVAREIRQGDEALQQEWQRLNALLGVEVQPQEPGLRAEALARRNLGLATAIREGAFDQTETLVPLVQHLRAVVAAKLEVSDPKLLGQGGG